MDENLVGYLLNALDPATQRQVEDYLHERPEARHRLELLRHALEPLAADRNAIEPPPGLALRTLAQIAAHRSCDLPQGSAIPALPRRWWGRADALVAAGLLLCALVLIPPGILYMRYRQDVTGCQNNLRVFDYALRAYSAQHNRAFPDVTRAFDDPAPLQQLDRYAAGTFVPMLIDAGVLREDVDVRCPARGAPMKCHWRLEQLKAMPPEEFRCHSQELAPCYAYSLGYWEGGQVHGLYQDDGILPIVSDSPPEAGKGQVATVGNSPNHGGHGQNVLFTDGHVSFLTERMLDDDDIYTNKDAQVAAGKQRGDNVLGPSAAHP